MNTCFILSILCLVSSLTIIILRGKKVDFVSYWCGLIIAMSGMMYTFGLDEYKLDKQTESQVCVIKDAGKNYIINAYKGSMVSVFIKAEKGE